MIRRATTDDLNRIAEIEVFNYRLQFYPIFRSDEFYFGELQVPNVANRYAHSLEDIRVWDDGVVKGFILVRSGEIKKLFVEPVLQGQAWVPSCWNMRWNTWAQTYFGLWRRTPGPSASISGMASNAPARDSWRMIPASIWFGCREETAPGELRGNK